MTRDFNTPLLPLESLTLHPRHHRAALWWLGWLYRNPDAFRLHLDNTPREIAVRATVLLFLHALPWMLLLGLLIQGMLVETIFGKSYDADYFGDNLLWLKHPLEQRCVEYFKITSTRLIGSFGLFLCLLLARRGAVLAAFGACIALLCVFIKSDGAKVFRFALGNHDVFGVDGRLFVHGLGILLGLCTALVCFIQNRRSCSLAGRICVGFGFVVFFCFFARIIIYIADSPGTFIRHGLNADNWVLMLIGILGLVFLLAGLLRWNIVDNPETGLTAGLSMVVLACLGIGLASGLGGGYRVALGIAAWLCISIGRGSADQRDKLWSAKRRDEVVADPFSSLAFGIPFGLIAATGGGLGGGLFWGVLVGVTAGSLAWVISRRLAAVLVVGLVFGLLAGIGGPFIKGFYGNNTVESLVLGLLIGLVAGIFPGTVTTNLGSFRPIAIAGGLFILGHFTAWGASLFTASDTYKYFTGYDDHLELSVGVPILAGTTIGFLISRFRLYYLPWVTVFWLVRKQARFYRFHPVAWDWHCRMPSPGLDVLLMHYGEERPDLVEAEFRRLRQDVPGQKSAASNALILLRVRRAGRVERLADISTLLAELPEGKRGYMAETRRVRELSEVIVRQQLRVDATSRPYFREIEARNLVSEVRNFQGRISGIKESLATEFRTASESWLKLAEAQATQARGAVEVEPAPQVFRAGDPVEGESEAFVPRFRILEELEGQIMLGGGCPGVLLRAPRRMGKSSLLKNIPGFLPKEVAVAFVSLLSARLFSSTGLFVGGLAEAVEGRLPDLAEFESVKATVRSNRPIDLAGFLLFLGDCNTALERAGWRLLLALDEYENLDAKLREGVFTKDLLATLRESIQSHRRIIWAFSGNADITELTGADWTSYLISVRTLEVPLFTPEETQLLLTQPLNHSALRVEDKVKSTLFWREFWGEHGIARVHRESGGWPYFVQLIADTAVKLANESAPGVKPLPPALLERALDESVSRGRITFHQLLRSQCREESGEWEYLAGFARRGTQPPPADAEVRRLLKRRQLLTETPGGEWRLVVPLMARWIRKES